MNEWEKLKGKKVKIFLKINNIIYHGTVICSGDDYIKILDKFDNPVLIPISNIVSVEEIT